MPLTQTPLPFLIAAAALLVAVGLALWATALRRRVAKSERERRRTADELNWRLSELFSLQELAYVLSGSLQLDRIVDQVVRYATRFLDARGALLALTIEQEGQTPQLRVAAAEGTLGSLKGQSIRGDDPGLVARSLGRERLELVRNSGDAPTELVSGVHAESAAAVPLRAHGAVVGTLVIAEPPAGESGRPRWSRAPTACAAPCASTRPRSGAPDRDGASSCSWRTSPTSRRWRRSSSRARSSPPWASSCRASRTS